MTDRVISHSRLAFPARAGSAAAFLLSCRGKLRSPFGRRDLTRRAIRFSERKRWSGSLIAPGGRYSGCDSVRKIRWSNDVRSCVVYLGHQRVRASMRVASATIIAVGLIGGEAIASTDKMTGSWQRGDGLAKVRITGADLPCAPSTPGSRTGQRRESGDRLVMNVAPKADGKLSGDRVRPAAQAHLPDRHQRGGSKHEDTRLRARRGGLQVRGLDEAVRRATGGGWFSL